MSKIIFKICKTYLNKIEYKTLKKYKKIIISKLHILIIAVQIMECADQ
jgi:hypothetical protein